METPTDWSGCLKIGICHDLRHPGVLETSTWGWKLQHRSYGRPVLLCTDSCKPSSMLCLCPACRITHTCKHLLQDVPVSEPAPSPRSHEDLQNLSVTSLNAPLKKPDKNISCHPKTKWFLKFTFKHVFWLQLQIKNNNRWGSYAQVLFGGQNGPCLRQFSRYKARLRRSARRQ